MRTAIPYAALVVGCLVSPWTLADNAHPRGAHLGFGGIPYAGSGVLATRNPAAEVAQGGRGTRLGIFGAGVGYEFGDVSDFGGYFEEIGDDADELSELVGGLSELDDLQDVLGALEQIGSTEESVNGLLETVAEDGYLAVSGQLHPPPFPLSVTQDALRGSLTVDLNYTFRAHLGILHKGWIGTGFGDIPTDPDEFDDNINTPDKWHFDPGTKIITDPDGDEYDLDSAFSLSDSGAYVQSVQVRTFSLGYGTGVLIRRSGVLYAGMRVNHHAAKLSRAAAFFDDDADSTLRDRYDENMRETSAMGIDVGVVWHGPQYRLGATVYNLAEPSFDYPDVGVDCEADDNNCRLLKEYADEGEIERTKTYVMERQLVLDGSYIDRQGRWAVGAALDVNSVEGAFGKQFNDEYQWVAVGGALRTRSYVVPEGRLGLRHNAVGNQLTLVTAGITFFRGLHLDTAVATETVGGAPRAFQLNLSAGTAF